MMKIRPLEDYDEENLKALLEEAFPIDEILPLEYYLAYRLNEGVMVYSFEERGRFIGFMQVVSNDDIVYLSYLAFFKSYQCKGYGSQAISYLKSLYPNSPIAVDREVIIPNGEDEQERRRRASFYIKNGFADVPCFQLQLGVVYQTMAYNGFSFLALKDLIEGISHKEDKTYWAYYLQTYEEAMALREKLLPLWDKKEN